MKYTKKYLSIVFMILILGSFTCFAEEVANSVSDFEYIFNEESYSDYSIKESVIITGYKGKSSTVVIPELIEMLPVVEIENDAFKNNKNIKTIKVPSSVKKIGKNAFADCTSLKEVYLDLAPIASIAEYAFGNCTALSKVVIESGIRLSLADYVFAECTSLTSITLPRSARRQGYASDTWPFYKCSALKTINYRGSKGDRLFASKAEDFFDKQWYEGVVVDKLYDDYVNAFKNGLTINYNYIGE